VNEWIFFYRLLGIDESVGEPNYYDLLGLTPQLCTAVLVDRALQKRKKTLRQNIPGPQFIALLFHFEREVLEPAAAVLRDAGQRDAYYLRLFSPSAEHPVLAVQTSKEKLARQARRLLQDFLAADGSLEESRRGPLAEKLREIGMPARDVDALLSRIPRPGDMENGDPQRLEQFFRTAADLAISENLLTSSDEGKLLELAEHLRLPRSQAGAIIDQQLQVHQAVRGERSEAFYKRRLEEQLRLFYSAGIATAEQRDYLMALAVMDGLAPATAQQILEAWQSRFAPALLPGQEDKRFSGESRLDAADQILEDILIPYRKHRSFTFFVLGGLVVVAAVLLILLIAHWLGHSGPSGAAKREDARRDSIDATSSSSPPAASRSRPPSASPVSSLEPAAAAKSAVRSEEAASDAAAAALPTSAAALPESVFAESVRSGFAAEGQPGAVCGDLAFAMLAVTERFSHILAWPGRWTQWLESADKRNEAALRIRIQRHAEPQTMAKETVLMAETPPTGYAAWSDEEQTELRRRLEGTERGGHLYAIEQLRRRGGSDSAALLLDALQDTAVQEDQAAVGRILSVLATMNEPSLLPRLIALIGQSEKPYVSHQIVVLLAQATRVEAASSGILPWMHERAQQSACARWWQEQLESGKLLWHPRRADDKATAPAAKKTADAEALATEAAEQPAKPEILVQNALIDYKAEEKIALLLFYTDHYFYMLQHCRWKDARTLERQPCEEPPAELEISGFELGTAVAQRSRQTTEALLRLSRTHPLAADFAASLDAVQLRQETLEALCDTLWQRLVIHYDAGFQVMKLLAMMTSDQPFPDERFAGLDEAYRREIGEAEDVFLELRRVVWYNVLLADILNQQIMPAEDSLGMNF